MFVSYYNDIKNRIIICNDPGDEIGYGGRELVSQMYIRTTREKHEMIRFNAI